MKRGISPLISTVLLIGFAITLAVFIFTWGMDFIRTTQEEVSEQSDIQFQCTSDVSFEVNCKYIDLNGKVTKVLFTITNNEDSIIKSIIHRIYNGDSFIESVLIQETFEEIGPFGISNTYSADISGENIASSSANIKTEILATEVETGGKILQCGEFAIDLSKCYEQT